MICSKCNGRMFWDASDREYACVACGARHYGSEYVPLDIPERGGYGKPVGHGAPYYKEGHLPSILRSALR